MKKIKNNQTLIVIAACSILVATVVAYIYAYVSSQRAAQEYIDRVKTNPNAGDYNLDTMTEPEFVTLQAGLDSKVDVSKQLLLHFGEEFGKDANSTASLINIFRSDQQVKTKMINDGCFGKDQYWIPYDETLPAASASKVDAYIAGEIKAPYELALARLSIIPIINSKSNI